MKHMCFLLFLAGLATFCTGAGADQFVYSGFAGTNLTVDGAAMVTSNGLLQLTNGLALVQGHAFYPTPLHFRKSPNGTVQSFSVTFVFSILSVYSDLSSHGMAFLIASSKNFSTAFPSQFLGLFNSQNNGNASNHIFAIELDTRLSVQFQDVNDNHVGIDINGLDSLDSTDAGFFDMEDFFSMLDLKSQEAMQVWVDYDGEATRIYVTLAPLNMAKPVRPLLSAAYNLSTVLTDPAYVGFSASTGTSGSRHCVLGWSFGINGPAPAIDMAILPKLSYIGAKARSKVMKIVLAIAVATLIFAMGIVTFLHVRRRLKYADLLEDWEIEFGPHRFLYNELFLATEGFNGKHLLGTGGFGRVYKGVLPTSKTVVAVKRVSHESRQGMREFIAEIVSTGRLRHRNIVQLLGYCRRKGELLLVYDYMPNGSVDKYLHTNDGRPTLDWTQRFQIIKGVASGLLYLHECWEQVLVHRDIKTSNVLLDKEMNGRLGDFDLVRLYNHGTDLQTTCMAGTIGYISPELARTDKTSPLTDVFAFGVFLLEITCGRRLVERNTQDSPIMLVDRVLECWHNRSLNEAVDETPKQLY